MNPLLQENQEVERGGPLDEETLKITQKPFNKKPYYRLDEIADIFEIHINTVKNWITEGKLIAVQLGYKTQRISYQSLDHFIKNLPNSTKL